MKQGGGADGVGGCAGVGTTLVVVLMVVGDLDHEVAMIRRNQSIERKQSIKKNRSKKMNRSFVGGVESLTVVSDDFIVGHTKNVTRLVY